MPKGGDYWLIIFDQAIYMDLITSIETMQLEIDQNGSDYHPLHTDTDTHILTNKHTQTD